MFSDNSDRDHDGQVTARRKNQIFLPQKVVFFRAIIGLTYLIACQCQTHDGSVVREATTDTTFSFRDCNQSETSEQTSALVAL